MLDAVTWKDFIPACAPSARRRIPTRSLATVMKLHLSAGYAIALCLAVTACYPYEDYQKRKKTTRGPQQRQTAEQAKQQEEELRKKQEEELKQAGDQSTLPPDGAGGQQPTQPTNPGPGPQLPTQPRTDYPFANKVPGKDGFVFSPYNNKVVDVRDIPSGTLVQDPTYPASEKKYFRVP